MLNRILCWLVVVSAFLAAPALALTGDIVDAKYVAGAIQTGAIVWDVRGADLYSAGHVTGAVNMSPMVLVEPTNGEWLPVDLVEKILCSAGIDLPGKEVIVYGTEGNPLPPFALLIGRYFGAKSCKLYRGGFDDWKAAGMAVATEPTRLASVTFKLTPQEDVVVWTDEVVRGLPGVTEGKVQLIDVRTEEEFDGRTITAIRGGHIPGAVNIPLMVNFSNAPTAEQMALHETDIPGGSHFKPKGDLRKIYARLDPNKETWVHCQSGIRSSEAVTLLRDLGFKNVRLYKSGWLVYARTLSAPVDDETFGDLGVANPHSLSLEARIDTLGKERPAPKRVK
jgi:thiosulfate/3-mercaptopyruvate sulfurtransferase